MTGVLQEVVRKAPLTPEKVAFAWRLSVGPAVDRATSVSLADDGVLYVRAETAAWIAAVRKSSPLIHRRLVGFLGADAVKSLRFDT